METPALLSFGPYHFVLGAAQLKRGSHEVKLTPKALAVLRLFLTRPGEVVTKDDLFETVWPGTVVSDDALTSCIQELRQALRDDAKRPRYIETVYRRGFRFIVSLATTPPSVPRSTLKVPEKEEKQKAKIAPPQDSALRTQHSGLVGREHELTQLHKWLDKALNGERQIVFVTGEPGIGKTTLVEAFLHSLKSGRQGQKEKRKVKSSAPRFLTLDPWVCRGQCIEHYGAGEGYLPVLEALGRLSREAGGRQVIEVLGHYAPTWLGQMPALVSTAELDVLQLRVQGATRDRMLRELAEALEVLTARHPLVLWLEDLQWSDVSTLDFLSALARRQERCRLLVLGTYRPVDVFVREHPLRAIKQELQLHGHCQELTLDFLSEDAVHEYLATRFPVAAREAAALRGLTHLIYQRTDGNPLFMVNVVEHFLSQRVIERTDEHWTVNAAAATATVPESLRQMIEQRLTQVPPTARTVLEVASVVGAQFSIAAVAAGVETSVEIVEEHCAELARREQFLRTSGSATWPDGTVTACYSFRHALYQEVLYERLSTSRRQRLHQHLGRRLEQGYGERAAEIAAELAMHCEQEQDYQRAIPYLWQAARNALHRSAPREAISLLTKGLNLLERLPDTLERQALELMLQTTLGTPLIVLKGYAAPEVKNAYARAQVLCQQIGENPQLFPVLLGLWAFDFMRGKPQEARQVGEQLLSPAYSLQSAGRLVRAHSALGMTLFFLGELGPAQEQLDHSLALYDPQRHRSYSLRDGQDFGVMSLSYVTMDLWLLGYPDQALRKSHEALTLAGELHPFSLLWALWLAAVFHTLRREGHAVHERTEALLALADEKGFPQFVGVGIIHRGVALSLSGQAAKGVVQIQQGLALYKATGMEVGKPYFLALLAETYGQAGRPEEGLTVLAEALEQVNRSGERVFEAELYRLTGQLVLQSSVQSPAALKEKQKAKGKNHKSANPQSPSQILDPPGEAESYFRRALDIAHQQQAKSLELRAATSLARLWQRQGKRHEAHRRLSEIYNWFTEGFNTQDLQEAKALLDDLTVPPFPNTKNTTLAVQTDRPNRPPPSNVR